MEIQKNQTACRNSELRHFRYGKDLLKVVVHRDDETNRIVDVEKIPLKIYQRDVEKIFLTQFCGMLNCGGFGDGANRSKPRAGCSAASVGGTSGYYSSTT